MLRGSSGCRSIRVRPIIIKGGASINAVLVEVLLKPTSGGKSVKTFLDANEKVVRSLQAGAMAIGAKVKISTVPGGMLFVTCLEL
jgi:hypothetical protein